MNEWEEEERRELRIKSRAGGIVLG